MVLDERRTFYFWLADSVHLERQQRISEWDKQAARAQLDGGPADMQWYRSLSSAGVRGGSKSMFCCSFLTSAALLLFV